MKFEITKKVLADSLSKMSTVATRGIKTDFAMVGRVTIKAEKDTIIFSSSNGHLDACIKVDKAEDANLRIEDTGIATVDVVVLNKVAKALGDSTADSNIILLNLKDKTLTVKDTTSKSKKVVRSQVSGTHHEIDIKKPTKGFSYTFDADILDKAINSLSRYVGKIGYKVRYLMLCLHFLENETRFICGDGMRFAILSCDETEPNPDITDEDGVKHLLPVDQATILSSLISGCKKVKVSYKSKQICHVQPDNNVQVCIRGIPNEDYITYEHHAFRMDEAENVVDVRKSDLLSGTSLVTSVRDAKTEDAGNFQSCQFVCEGNMLRLVVAEGDYNCDYDCEVDMYNLAKRSVYKSQYASQFLTEVANADNSEYVRFYCLDEGGTIIAQLVNLQDNKDENGVPIVNRLPTDPQLSFFFAAVTNEDD